jgi:hypothetical protein
MNHIGHFTQNIKGYIMPQFVARQLVHRTPLKFSRCQHLQPYGSKAYKGMWTPLLHFSINLQKLTFKN